MAEQLTLLGTLDGSPVGFASLKAPTIIDMLYVHPAAAGNGVGTMLIDALEKLAAARGAGRLTADVSDSAGDFFTKRGFVPQTRNTVPRGDEWLANTTMEKKLAAKERRHEQARHAVPAALALLHRPRYGVIAVAVLITLLHDLPPDLRASAHATKPSDPTPRSRSRDRAVAALALLSNFYLW